VAIGAEAEELEIDAAGALDGGFVVQRFVFEIGGVTVGEMRVAGREIDVTEEVFPHEGGVALRVRGPRPMYSSRLKVVARLKSMRAARWRSINWR